jgi:hypothetical protein
MGRHIGYRNAGRRPFCDPTRDSERKSEKASFLNRRVKQAISSVQAAKAPENSEAGSETLGQLSNSPGIFGHLSIGGSSIVLLEIFI